MILIYMIFILSGFFIFWAMIGYPIFIRFLGKILKNRKLVQDRSLKPTVTVMVVAHNEQEVIKDKLDNLLNLDYPKNKIKYIITSDFSTDKTDEIVENFINEHSGIDLKLHKARQHLGKTNAQNEAQKLVDTEFLVMSDANSMLKENAVSELMSMFTDDSISYVTGVLKYVNQNESDVANSESTYWEQDVSIRDIEGRIQTITAGNGALYAVRNAEYVDFKPIECHDSAMPFYYAIHQQRAVNCISAIAYEKAGETDYDEFKRKVRMNRIIIDSIRKTINIINIFKYKWFTIFYISHRTLRYLLWFNHILLFASSAVLGLNNIFFLFIFFLQFLFYILAAFAWKFNCKNKLFKLCGYYLMTISAQIVAVAKTVRGTNKATWEKAESTR